MHIIILLENFQRDLLFSLTLFLSTGATIKTSMWVFSSFLLKTFWQVFLHSPETNYVDQAGLDPAEDPPASASLVLSSQTWPLPPPALLLFFSLFFSGDWTVRFSCTVPALVTHTLVPHTMWFTFPLHLRALIWLIPATAILARWQQIRARSFKQYLGHTDCKALLSILIWVLIRCYFSSCVFTVLVYTELDVSHFS